MYYMLSGEYPFKEPNLDLKIQEEPVNFDGDRWTTVSFDSKDLISKLLDKNPELRITAQDSL